MSIKGFEMLREHMSYYDFNPDSVLLLGNVLYYLKQAEGEVAELESENKKLRELVWDMWSGMCGYAHDCRNCEHYELREGQRFVGKCEYYRRMRELGIEVDE